ncbi:MAG: ATP-dependent RNA helicase HrpA [Pseudomonadota bacterium]
MPDQKLEQAIATEDLMLRERYARSRGRPRGENDETRSAQLLVKRKQWVPEATPDVSLPIEARREEIIAALTAHQVLVVSGETGSGKTTQLPRYALAAGLGRTGMIGHTQPRRIAARSVAARIAELTGTRLGDGVGYAVRFDDKSSDATLVRVMTDGVLLNEIANDPLLLKYEVIIIDEAHERSLNIDFLLGLLKQLLPKRPDLKVIITSATIDHERFAAHFDDAPVIEVSGRGYPVEIVYDEGSDIGDDARLLARRVCEAVRLIDERQLPKGAGDILVFLPGEREIRDCERALIKSGLAGNSKRDALPLFGRLSDQQQQAVFTKTGRRRIVLATNVAETSLTVPRIGAVIDSGLARISRYSSRSRIQRLQLEPVSQASANQRAGRCGRIGPGVCLRLYQEAAFEARPLFTDAEILRTNLASVVLQMHALRLGDIAAFPFLDSPDYGQIDDAERLLIELEALDAERRLTKAGRDLAKLPLDPRLARMLLHPTPDIAGWLVVLVAGLAIQDPRQRPMESSQAADAAHASFVDERSDFLTLLNVWRSVQQQRKASGRAAFERWCDTHFLSPRRLREWQEVVGQLAKQMRVETRNLPVDKPPTEQQGEALHRAILAGLLSNIGTHNDKGEYAGAGGRKFRIHPSSVLKNKTPKWVMAVEIVQTRQRMARYVAPISVAWLQAQARHVLEFDHEQPYWNARRGRVEAKRTSLLFGLVVRANERVDFRQVDRVMARDVFLREALAEDRLRLRASFVDNNRQLRSEIAAMEGRLRRPVEVSVATLANWFGERLPASVTDQRSLKRWLAKSSDEKNKQLMLTASDLLAEAPDTSVDALPSVHDVGGNRLRIDYAFAPEEVHDGASIRIPRALLTSLRHAQVDASVPAYLQKRVEARLRKLPKATRKQLQPLAERASRLTERLIAQQERGRLDERLTRLLLREYNIDVDPLAFADIVEPAHWRPRIVVVDDQGKPVASGRELSALKPSVTPDDSRNGDTGVTQSNSVVARDWQFSDIEKSREQRTDAATIQVFPALKIAGSGVTVHEFLDAEMARISHGEAVRALLGYRFVQQLKSLRKQLLSNREVALHWAAYDDAGAKTLVTDVEQAALMHTFTGVFSDVRDKATFDALSNSGASKLMGAGESVIASLIDVLKAAAVARQRLSACPDHMREAVDDVEAQVDALVYPGFLSKTPVERLSELPRYLTAAHLRLEKHASNPSRDTSSMAMVHSLSSRIAGLRGVSVGPLQSAAIRDYRWQIEELRVSLFAQQLGTLGKISAKRLEKQWDDILRMTG